MKKRKFDDGGEVDFDKDSDPEAQKVERNVRYTGVIASEEPAKTSKPASEPKSKAANKPHTAGKIGPKVVTSSAAPVPARNPIVAAVGSRGSIKPRAEASYTPMPRRNPLLEAMDSTERIKPRSAATYAKGGKVSSASNRADGCAQRGKTRGKMV